MVPLYRIWRVTQVASALTVLGYALALTGITACSDDGAAVADSATVTSDGSGTKPDGAASDADSGVADDDAQHSGALSVKVEIDHELNVPLDTSVHLVAAADCASIDSATLPAVTGNEPDGALIVVAPRATSTVDFADLEPERDYAVVAKTRDIAPMAAEGCVASIRFTAEDATADKTLKVALTMQTADPAAALVVTTRPATDWKLTKFETLLDRMIELDSLVPSTDLADYIVDLVIANASPDLALVLGLLSNQLRSALTTVLVNAAGAAQSVRKKLSQLTDYRLRTKMVFSGATGDPARPKAVAHSFDAITAKLSGQNVAFGLGTSGTLLDGSDASALSATASVSVDSDDRTMAFGAHTLRIPLVDAVLGVLLADAFGTRDLQTIAATLSACEDVASKAVAVLATVCAQNPGSPCPDLDEADIRTLCETEVRDELLEDLRKAIADDRAALNLAAPVALEGKAQSILTNDGKVLRLNSGEWNGLGNFSGR